MFLVVAFIAGILAVDSDTGIDLRSVLVEAGGEVGRLRWQFAAILVCCVALHYLAAGLGARAVMTVPGRLGEATMVQLAAAAANRVTPAGLGGSAVNARYFCRRSMSVSAAFGAVATLALLGAVADLITGITVVGLGSVGGIDGSTRELHQIASFGAHLAGPLQRSWPWVALAAGVLVAFAAVLARRVGWSTALRGRRGALAPAWQLCRQPSRLAQLMLASSATTLLQGCGFVCAVWMVPGSRPAVSAGGLLVGYLLASAVSSTIPVPSGLGSTEAALVAVLIAARVSPAQAVEQVMLFRVVTFWSPAVLGLLISRRLHRTGVL